jgi:RNA recognition motif-containing protein
MSLQTPNNVCTIFIGDLSAFCEESHLYQAFRPFGEIEVIKLMKNKKNKPMGYGFVTYQVEESCHKALVMGGTLFQGRPIR